jgi:hypothetical protein
MSAGVDSFRQAEQQAAAAKAKLELVEEARV